MSTSMRLILALIFLVSNLYFILRIIKQPHEVFTFPFLISAAAVIFIIPTSIVSIFLQTLSDIEYNLYIGNAIVCFWCGILGYYSKKNVYTTVRRYSQRKIIGLCTIVYVVGMIASVAIVTDWAIVGILGLPIVLFVSRFLRAVIIIILMSAAVRKTAIKLWLILLWIWYPIYLVLVLGRRSSVAFLAIAFTFPRHFIKNYVPRPGAVLIGLFVAIWIVVLFPIYRMYTMYGNYYDILSLDARVIMIDFLLSQRTNEFTEACINMGAVFKAGNYNFGSGFVNDMIFQFVPAGLVGDEVKRDLFINESFNLHEIRQEFATGGEYIPYIFQTGYANMFYEFGVMACIPFFFLGRLSKALYLRAKQSDLVHIAIYCTFAMFIPFAIYSSFTKILPIYLPALLTVIAVFRFSRKKLT